LNWIIRLSDKAEKDLLAIHGPDRTRITDRLLALEFQPRTFGVIKIKDSPLYRLRIGNWRAILEIDDARHLVWVIRLLRRSEKTYREF
jgi:mRNA-degrading endonuclease RelE of RelBE toxin-antitoxin system